MGFLDKIFGKKEEEKKVVETAPTQTNLKEEVTSEYVKELTDEDELIDIVKNNSDEDIRALAVTKINDETFLKDIVANDSSSYVRYQAVGSIRDEEYLKNLAINDPDLSATQPTSPCSLGSKAVTTLLKIADDKDMFLDILKNAKCFSVRGSIVREYLSDEDILVDVVKNDSSDVVRRYAAEKLSSNFNKIKEENLLKLVEVAKDYPYYHVREVVMEFISKQDKSLLKDVIDNSSYEDGVLLAKKLYEK